MRPTAKTPSVYIVPPFADPHIHGGWEHSFQKGDFELLEKKLIKAGVFFAIPTLQNTGLDALKETARRFQIYTEANPRSIFPFLRVEGPFISPEKRGFQRDDFILEANPTNIRDFLDIAEIRLFTFAPERAGLTSLIEKALSQGKIPSIGHSLATYAEFQNFHRLGIRHMTHFPNAMSGLHHREIGLVGAGLVTDDLQLEVIGDGIHTSWDFLRMLLRVKGPTFGLVSDMIPPAFGASTDFDGRRLQLQGKRFTTEEGTLAGGGTPVNEQVPQMLQAGIPPEHLVPLACLNTLAFFGRPVPRLVEQAEASFLVLDDRFTLQEVFRGGEGQ
jgi:N-acetylglucosamine-6-phosphate deacetylase